ncbi:hypothetical protein K438DRAFT_1752524 [Mycena galopus ATCC 62051]|nr:hypothetical protein K438DRAFT_1752524 [Mycena galopus ATCC 62051]
MLDGDYKILHSSQYWQDLRRCAKEVKAACEDRQSYGEISQPGDDAYIFTFVPGRAQPYMSIRDRNGRIVLVFGPSKSAVLQERGRVSKLVAEQKAQLEAKCKTRATWAKQLQQRAADADTALLARLQGKRRTPGACAEESNKRFKGRAGAFVRDTETQKMW